MNDFIENLENTLLNEFNESVTENGALGFRTTGRALLDLNFVVSSLRALPDEEVLKKYAKAFYENKLLAIKWLFFASDVRGGMGERRLFRLCYKFLAENEPKVALALMPLVAEYTRFDNLLPLLDTPLAGDVCSFLKEQILRDKEAMEKGESISLCAKWMPSINTSSLDTRNYAKFIVNNWGITAKEYRKLLAELRAYTNVLEVKMSAGMWSEIDYEAVPSLANNKYREVFSRHDKERRDAYLEKVKSGTAKINSSVLFPHNIVHNYTKLNMWDCEVGLYDETLEALWKNLPDYVKGQGNTICVMDDSGSMESIIKNTNVSCLEIAAALSIYFAERSSGIYKDKFITFSERPQFIDLSSGKNLHDKLAITYSHSEVANTNVEKVFDLILLTALKSKATQEEMPANVLILSDMEFDACAESNTFELRDTARGVKLFEAIANKYAHYGYKLPRLVFWNLSSRTETIPMKENALGVALVSGFSPSIMDMVLSNELDPFKCLLDKLNGARYDAVQKAVIDLV